MLNKVQETLIANALTQFGELPDISEYIELFESTQDIEKLKQYFEAMETAHSRLDVKMPAVPVPEKIVFEFEIPSKSVSIASLLIKVEKLFPAPAYNQLTRLNDAKQKLDSCDFEPVIGGLAAELFNSTDCTATQAFFVLKTAAMQFNQQHSEKALIDLISKVYTEYRHYKETVKHEAACADKEVSNSLVVEQLTREDIWREVADRVVHDPQLCKVFPGLASLDLESPSAKEALASLVCIKVNKEKHLLLDPVTLKHTYECRGLDEAVILIMNSGKEFSEYRNPLCVIERFVESEGEAKLKKVPRTEIYETHVTFSKHVETDLRANAQYEVFREDNEIGVKQAGIKRASISPVWNDNCDSWMRLLTGNNYSKVVTWTANSFDFSTALPVLSFLGDSNTGKSLLIMAITEQLKSHEKAISPMVHHETPYNGALLTNPFVVADDGGLEVTRQTLEIWKDRYKQYVTTSSWGVNPKYGGQVSMHGFLRSYCAFNKDKPHIRKLFNERNVALGERILDVEVPEENTQALRQMFKDMDVYGELDPSNKWLGKDGLLTCHVAYLIHNKDNYPVPEKTGRWGNMVDYKYTGEIAGTRQEQGIIEFLHDSLTSSNSYCFIHEVQGIKHAVINLTQFFEALKLSTGRRDYLKSDITNVFRRMEATNKPVTINGDNARKWLIPMENIGEPE